MSVAKHTVFNVVGALLPLPISLITIPLYIKVVGVERYGVLALCLTLLVFAQFISFGLGPAIGRGLALLSDAKSEERSSLFWTGLCASCVLAAAAFPVIDISVHYYSSSIFGDTSLREEELRSAVPWVAVLFSCSIPGGLFSSALQGRRRFDLLLISNAVGALALAMVPLLAAYFIRPDLPTLLIALTAANLFVYLLLFAFCVRTVPLRSLGRPSPKLLMPLMQYGSWMTVIAFMTPFTFLIDRFIISDVAGPGAVALYVIAYNLVSRVVLIAAALSNSALPRITAAQGVDEKRRLADLALRSLLAILTPGCVLGLILVKPFFTLWLGTELAEQTIVVATVLLVGMFAHGMGHIGSLMLMARGRADVIAGYLVLTTPIYIYLLTLLAARYGVVGAAIAWAGRAFMDYLLLLWSRPPRHNVERLMACNLLVVAAAFTTSLPESRTAVMAWAIIFGLTCFYVWSFARPEILEFLDTARTRLKIKSSKAEAHD